MSIPSPYYFVPRNDQVVLLDPTEAQSISQDRPFEDGLCGSFQITFTATTPIFTRDSTSPDTFFQLPGGRFAILPASVTGAVRQILGAAAFGKLKRVADHVYSVRNLNDEKYRRLVANVEGGWLSLTPEGPIIHPCPAHKVRQDILEAAHRGLDLGKKQSAIDKYAAWAAHGAAKLTGTWPDSDPKKNGANNTGTLVFAGQPFPRGMNPQAKFTECVFGAPDPESLPVPDRVFIDFLTLHEDPEGIWKKRWLAKFQSGERVPVFFEADASGKVTCMGLSQMMRVPSPARLHERLGPAANDHLSDHLDLPDAIFGFAANRDGDGLRRRADFSVFTAVGENIQPMAIISTLLAEPKASYYPNYLQQPPNGDLVTYLDDAKVAPIRGRKFYAARADSPNHSIPKDHTHPKQNTRLTPLPADTVFTGRCHIHNLRPYELGALVWALTFGEYPSPNPVCRLRLGGGKPFGLGCVQVSLSDPRLRPNDPGTETTTDRILSDAVAAFETWMQSKVPDWKTSPQIRELIAIHRSDHGVGNEHFDYPKLSTGDNRTNQFQDFIRARQSLPDFSSLLPPDDPQPVSAP